MAETPLNLQDIRRRHARVASAYTHFTQAEHDRGALLAEVDRLRADVQRLQHLVEQLQRDAG